MKTKFRTYDIRQVIEKIDPAVRKRKTLTYEFSNGKKFYKNELPGVPYIPPPSQIILPPGTLHQFVTSAGQNFITSDGQNFKVQPA